MTFSLTVSGGKFKNEKLTSWEFKGSTHHGRKKKFPSSNGLRKGKQWGAFEIQKCCNMHFV